MLAGCSSSTLLSPRNRLRSESAAQYQACHLQLPSMSTQRLDLPCNFSRKETSRSQSIRPVALSVENPLESKTSGCSLRQKIRLPPLATSQLLFTEGRREIKEDQVWKKGKSLKRFAEQIGGGDDDGDDDDESCISSAKRKRGSSDYSQNVDFLKDGEEDSLILSQFGGGNFWFTPDFSEHGVTGLHPEIPSSLTCSGDEERGCLISPPSPFLAEITELGETSHGRAQDGFGFGSGSGSGSGSTSSSESERFGLRITENVAEQEVGNGSRNPYNPQHPVSGLDMRDVVKQEEEQGFELISLLIACVEAIGSKNIALISHLIDKLGILASPRGGSSISRLIAYYSEALALRVTRLWPQVFHITTPRDFDRIEDDSSATALRLLNEVSPIPKFIHFTSNEILLRAFEGKDRVHIIDFDIKQGLQWPSLFQSLASRKNPPSHVRITGIGDSKQELNETGDRLAGFAEALGLPFEFHAVVDRLEDVRLWMLHVKEHESVAVNCILQLHKTLYDRNGAALRDFLGLIKTTNPSIVLIAEQEAEHNEIKLETRVSNTLRYYSAIFDSIDASLPSDSSARLKIEEMFAREIRNIIACEGRDRFERHTSFVNWKKMMEQGGFRSVPIRDREFLQSQMLLKMYSSDSQGYNVKKLAEENEAAATTTTALSLSWEDQSLYTVSAWTSSAAD